MTPDTDKNYFGVSAFNALKNVADVARQVMTGEVPKEEKIPEEPQAEIEQSESDGKKKLLKESDNG
jgi:hypothetical protein